MNKDEARVLIINELGKHTNRNDILMELCQELDINWEDADRLVKEVETYDGRTIARRQSPLLIILGAGVLIGGTALTVQALLFFWDFAFMAPAQQLVMSQYAYYMGGGFFTGLAMLAGGIVGFRKFLSAAL
jgi:hypothetical protein